MVDALVAVAATSGRTGRLDPALAVAISERRPDLAETLLARGANLAHGEEPALLLRGAASEGDTATVAWLLERGVPVDPHLSDQVTPLHCAADHGRAAMVSFLIAHGADVDARNRGGETPLLRAVQRGYVEVARILLEHRADPNARDARGRTPLSYGDDATAALLRGAGGID